MQFPSTIFSFQMTDKGSSNWQVFKSECLRIGLSPIHRKSSKIIIVTSTKRKLARENTLQKETWRKNQHKTEECTALTSLTTFCDLKHCSTIPHQIYNQWVSFEIPNTRNTIAMPVSVEILKQSAHMSNQTNATQISKKWVTSWNSVWIKHVEDTNRLHLTSRAFNEEEVVHKGSMQKIITEEKKCIPGRKSISRRVCYCTKRIWYKCGCQKGRTC